MNYPGGKAQDGVFQQIICQIPPHRVYIEPFCGGAAILRFKKPSKYSIAIDADAAAVDLVASLEMAGLTALVGDALEFLATYDWQGDEFVYADPPYLMEVRSSRRTIYTHEFHTESEHRKLLDILTTIPAMVAISGYPSSCYSAILDEWRTHRYRTVTRGGTVVDEWLWMNYPEPKELHDYRYLGSNFREREKITRQKRRWLRRLARMPALQRYAMLGAIAEFGELDGRNSILEESPEKTMRTSTPETAIGPLTSSSSPPHPATPKT